MATDTAEKESAFSLSHDELAVIYFGNDSFGNDSFGNDSRVS